MAKGAGGMRAGLRRRLEENGNNAFGFRRRFTLLQFEYRISAPLSHSANSAHGCQMAKFDPFLSLDCARVEGVGAQSKERKGSNFAAQHSRTIAQKLEGPNT